MAGLHHAMVKTRHGRKVRLPRSLLSPATVEFRCQLCDWPSLPSHREYVNHMIDQHLRVQLLSGLDMSKQQPACPFPSCHGLSWPLVDSLLYHYASHHNVLEKVLLFETEHAAAALRGELAAAREVAGRLGRENEELRGQVGELVLQIDIQCITDAAPCRRGSATARPLRRTSAILRRRAR
jgi:hypothetical protein